MLCGSSFVTLTLSSYFTNRESLQACHFYLQRKYHSLFFSPCYALRLGQFVKVLHHSGWCTDSYVALRSCFTSPSSVHKTSWDYPKTDVHCRRYSADKRSSEPCLANCQAVFSWQEFLKHAPIFWVQWHFIWQFWSGCSFNHSIHVNRGIHTIFPGMIAAAHDVCCHHSPCIHKAPAIWHGQTVLLCHLWFFFRIAHNWIDAPDLCSIYTPALRHYCPDGSPAFFDAARSLLIH
jgi:hypothetical protein